MGSTIESCHNGESTLNMNDPTTASTSEINTPRNAPNAVPKVVSIPDMPSKDSAREITALKMDDNSRTTKKYCYMAKYHLHFQIQFKSCK